MNYSKPLSRGSATQLVHFDHGGALMNLKRSHERLVKVDGTDPEQVAQVHSIIRLLYRVNRRTSIRKNVRFRELETVFAHCWHGTRLPDDDAGRDCLFITACHLWHLGRKRGADTAITEWAELRAPWCGAEELAALIERVAANPRTWTADELAHELGYILPFSVRQALGLTTIGSIDVDKKGREQRRAGKHKDNSTKWRRRHGAVPRAEYLAKNSTSQDEPWVPLGISRATYYRRLKAQTERETSPNTPNKGSHLLYTDLSHVKADSAARPSATAQAPVSLVVRQHVLEGEIADDGVALAPPRPASHLERALAWALVLD
jgi:hypothetical protein